MGLRAITARGAPTSTHETKTSTKAENGPRQRRLHYSGDKLADGGIGSFAVKIPVTKIDDPALTTPLHSHDAFGGEAGDRRLPN